MQEKSGGRPGREKERAAPTSGWNKAEKRRESSNDEGKKKKWKRPEEASKKEEGKGEKWIGEGRVVVPSRRSRFPRWVALLKSSRYLKKKKKKVG